jgi:hypothetical protein
MDQPAATLIIGILAALGWVYTNRINRVLARRRHTFEMFQSYLKEKEFVYAIKSMGNLVRQNIIPAHYMEKDRDLDIDTLMYLINHYEFISAAIYNGDLDENFIRSAEFSRMVRLIDFTPQFVKSIRDERPQPTFAENLEHLVARWRNENPTNRDGIIEWLSLRPRRNWESPASK